MAFYKYYDNDTDEVVTVSLTMGEVTRRPFKTEYAIHFVVAHTYYDGDLRTLLNAKLFCEVFRMMDGFGPNFQGEYDWSHIRDSSDEAFIAAADYIVRNVWNDADLDAKIAKARDVYGKAGFNLLHALQGFDVEEHGILRIPEAATYPINGYMAEDIVHDAEQVGEGEYSESLSTHTIWRHDMKQVCRAFASELIRQKHTGKITVANAVHVKLEAEDDSRSISGSMYYNVHDFTMTISA